MRRVLGPLLIGLGGFLLVTALLASVYAPGKLKVTPLNVNSFTYLTGNAAVLPTGPGSAVKAVSHTVANGQKSDSDVVVFDSFTCVVKDPDGTAPDCVNDQDTQDRLVTASTDTFATNRRTGLALNDAKYVGDGAAKHEGLINKFPFDVEKKTYPFWDGLLQRPVDAVFSGVEKTNDLETYKFVITLTDEPAQIADGVDGTYSDEKAMWIDPGTGSIINQTEHQVRKLADGTTALDLDLKFADDTVKKNVADAHANNNQLGLLGALPLPLGIAGLLSTAVGFFLGRRQGDLADPRA